MKKLQSFFVLKFSSSRLKEYKYNIDIDFSDAQKNGELVKLGSNEVIRTLQRIKGINFNQEEFSLKIKEKKKLLKQPDNKENRLALSILNYQIENILYIPDLVSVVFDNKFNYLEINKKELIINKVKYKRFLAGAANLRKNTVFFLSEKYFDEMNYILNNNRDLSIPINESKNSAYWGLYNSSSSVVSWPKIVVIKDYEIKKIIKCNWVSGEGKNVLVEEKEVEVTQNCFDGQGLANLKIMQQWSNELDLDYNICWAIIRAPFLKGMLCSFDIQGFAKENNKEIIIDAWGKEVEVENIDIIISTSQFKMWQNYNSWEDYIYSCKKNKLSFGISRFSPKKDDDYVMTNYQYLQTLDLNNSQIESICKDTLDYFNNLLGEDNKQMLMFLLGKNIEKIQESFDNSWWKELDDNVIKALFLNESVKNDIYIQQLFQKSLNKKIRDSYLGQLFIRGNYQVIISDLVAQCEWALGMDVKGVLKEKQYYSQYWNNNNIDFIIGCRSPLTAKGEMNEMPLVNNIKYFENLYTGIVIPYNGNDSIQLSSSDFDGDILMTTNSKEFIEGIQNAPLISYAENKGEKHILNSELTMKADLNSFGSKIGYITNISSSLYCLQSKYEKDSKEYKEIEKRLIECRFYQGGAIDKAKSVNVPDIPKHYTQYQKIDYSLPEEEIEKIKFENNLTIRKRPLFFRFLYSDYNRKYLNELKNYNFLSRIRYKIPFQELLKSENLTEDQQKLIDKYYDTSFFIHSSSIMNKISSHLQDNIKEIKINSKKNNFDYNIYISKKFVIDLEKIEKIKKYYQEYNQNKKSIKQNNYDGYDKESFINIDQYVKYLRKKILSEVTNNIQELANLCVYITYRELKNGNKDFCWKIISDGIVLNLIENLEKDYINVPIRSKDGNFEYLFSKYKLEKIKISDLE